MSEVALEADVLIGAVQAADHAGLTKFGCVVEIVPTITGCALCQALASFTVGESAEVAVMRG